MSWYIIRQCDSNFKPFKNVKVTVISWVNFSRIFEKWQQFSRLGIMMECPVFLPSCLLAYCRFSATLKLNNNKLKTMIFLDLHDILRKFWVYKKKGLKLFFFFPFLSNEDDEWAGGRRCEQRSKHVHWRKLWGPLYKIIYAIDRLVLSSVGRLSCCCSL